MFLLIGFGFAVYLTSDIRGFGEMRNSSTSAILLEVRYLGELCKSVPVKLVSSSVRWG